MKTRKDKLLNMTVQGRVMKETVTEDGNKLGWANSFIKLSRHKSNLVWTPYTAHQQYLND